MNEVNNYRKSLGLNMVVTNTQTCNFAWTRATEIAVNFTHDGFNNRLNSNTLPYNGFSKVTENLAKSTNYKDVVNTWIQSGVHSQNMRADTPFVCIQRYGDYYAYEGWKP